MWRRGTQRQQDVEDDRMIALVLSEEYAKLDGAVARRLSNLAPAPVSSTFGFLIMIIYILVLFN